MFYLFVWIGNRQFENLRIVSVSFISDIRHIPTLFEIISLILSNLFLIEFIFGWPNKIFVKFSFLKFGNVREATTTRVLSFILNNIWDKLFKNGPSKICGRQPLKNLKGCGLPKAMPN